MALKLDFYKEIIEKEKIWLTTLEHNILNVYYLPELRDFYVSKQEKLNEEAKATGNFLIASISNTIQVLILKLDSIINTYHLSNEVDLKELSDYFFINVLNNSFVQTKDSINEVNKSDKIMAYKNNLYEVREKITNLDNEDYIDDDFYYSGKAV